MVRRYLMLFNSLFIFLLIAAPLIFANGTGDTTKTMVEMALNGRDETYRLYLPAAFSQPVSLFTGTVSTDFNQPTDLTAFDFPLRVYWEMSVSDCRDGKNVKMPQLLISPSDGDGDSNSPDVFVNQSYTAETQYGSFILPPHTGMVVRVNTGSWQKRSGLFSNAYGYDCKLKISYQLVESNLPQQLIPVNTAIVNDYINRMILDHENKIKTAIVNENLYDLKFHKVNFQINSGELTVAFTAYYQGRGFLGIPVKTEASGTAAFEVRISGDGTRIGLYGKGLVGKFDVARDLGLLDAWGRSYINKKIAGQEYWSGGEIPSSSRIFKSDNLIGIINQALLSDRFHPFQYEMLGGLAQIRFKNIEFRELNLEEGRAEASCRLGITIKLLGNELFNLDDAGSVDHVKLVFYIDSSNQSWWMRITGFHVTLNGLSSIWNDLANNLISKKLEERNGLIPLNIPSFIDKLPVN